MKQLTNVELPPRSLKAILLKMATTSHLVKPSKARVHAQNLVEVLPGLVEMNEDMVQEALGTMLTRLSPALFYYSSESEMKSVIRLLLQPLLRSSPTQQRAASNAIGAVCNSARKPILTASWVISGLLRKSQILSIIPCYFCIFRSSTTC